jgi:hypothetical protein
VTQQAALTQLVEISRLRLRARQSRHRGSARRHGAQTWQGPRRSPAQHARVFISLSGCASSCCRRALGQSAARDHQDQTVRGGALGGAAQGGRGPTYRGVDHIRPELHALRATWSSFDVKCTKRTRGQVDSQPLGLSLFLCARAGSRGEEHAHPSRALESFMSSCPPATWPPPPPPSSRPSSSCSRTCSSAEGSGRRRTARPRPRRPCRW